LSKLSNVETRNFETIQRWNFETLKFWNFELWKSKTSGTFTCKSQKFNHLEHSTYFANLLEFIYRIWEHLRLSNVPSQNNIWLSDFQSIWENVCGQNTKLEKLRNELFFFSNFWDFEFFCQKKFLETTACLCFRFSVSPSGSLTFKNGRKLWNLTLGTETHFETLTLASFNFQFPKISLSNFQVQVSNFKIKFQSPVLPNFKASIYSRRCPQYNHEILMDYHNSGPLKSNR
jgi:hypothetical protein